LSRKTKKKAVTITRDKYVRNERKRRGDKKMLPGQNSKKKIKAGVSGKSVSGKGK